ncbi:cytochrome P450 CYP749A22-like [Papaver somniferum]|uniref:cytochrome P450 CYP749A22-like n=1 Tax=Papaver somniferum TaxID=3469 RepID=UPI000E704189|nr:cytochrome P450 CYP749A22-like [Papaver somniferum]
MTSMGIIKLEFLLVPVCAFLLYLLFLLIKFIHKVWWNPIYITKFLASQGINGPRYKLLHGNAKEILKMANESKSKPMEELSHQIFPYLQPFRYACIKTYGKIHLSWIGPRPQLFVSEVELIKEIMNDKDGVYPKTKSEGYFKKLLGDGLVSAQGNKWIKQRKQANHAFHAESLKGMVPSVIAAVETMVEKWKMYEGKEIEVFEEFRILTSEVISRTAFGSSYAEGKNVFEMMMKLGSIVSASFLKIRLPGIGKLMPNQDDIESDRLEQEIRKSILGLVQKREETRRNGGYGSDYLGMLMKATHEADEKKRISVDDMIDECKTFYLAGHETTTTLLTWTCLLLAINTEWQDKARKEVFDLLGENNPAPDDNSIGKLKILSMIINETLRLYPPVVAVVRRVAREVKVGNRIVLPANIELSISTVAVQHDPEIWGEDVHLFKPERFAEGIAKATNNNTAAFLPFGLGPRVCVGSNFAITEAKIALVMILQRYHFTLSPAYVHSPTQRITTRPQHGLQIMLHAL